MPKVIKPPVKRVKVVTDPLTWRSTQTSCAYCEAVYQFWVGDFTPDNLYPHENEYGCEVNGDPHYDDIWKCYYVNIYCPTATCGKRLRVPMPTDLGKRIFKTKELDPSSFTKPDDM